MKIPSYQFNSDVKIYNIGDVHRGNAAFDKPLFDKVVDTIAGDPLAYWVSTGDLMEVALKSSKGDVYMSMGVEREFTSLCRELQPIAKKCLGIVESNHHARFYRETGMSLDQRICDTLGIGDRFLGPMGLIKIICGKAPYYIAMHHGVGGGLLRGSKTTNLNRFSNVLYGADIYLEGHTHSFDHHIDLCYNIDRKRGLLGIHDVHFVCTGHFIKWHESYARNLKLKAMPLGVALLQLQSHEVGQFKNKKVTVDLFS